MSTSVFTSDTGKTLDFSRKRPIFCGLVIFAIGFAVRFALILHSHPATVIGNLNEPVRVALSLLSTGRFADAFGPGEGPTAHCAPAYPFLLSLLFRIFGTGAGGVIAMMALSSAAASAAFALLPALSVAGGMGLAPGLWAGLAGALLPINFWTQTVGAFEAPAAALFVVLLCIMACRAQTAASYSLQEGLGFGVVAGLGCLVSPTLMPLFAGWVILLAIKYRAELLRVVPFVAVAAITIVVTLAPWAIRNYFALGSLVWTRSDFGLELQVSNNDMMTADNEVNVRKPEFALVHPNTGHAEFLRVQKLGEVAYGRAKEREALAWIATHKQRFAILTVERAWLFWFPNMRRAVQSACEAIITVLGLCGLVLSFRRRLPIFWIALPAFSILPLVYYLVEASPRYRFPIEPLMFLFAAGALARLRRSYT